ncbi:T9SS type B sorting domain-containing protein [Flavobacterium sp. DGU11]|uniref:T9SS type B sorting domain-containing protein n=1 Tax=Flavobacterium arundinis TaxID=3139143 RepID=A0ABU9HVB4_9FLAO
MKSTFRRWLLALILLPFVHLNAQTDCPDAIIVCGNATYSGLNATGVGTQELNIQNACSSQEHNSLWLKILIKDGGTLGFILTPENDNLVVDFDFWVYGPNVTCGNLGTAIRCSTTNPGAAGLTSNITGMNGTETDVSEGPNGDGNAWINWIEVNDDEIYYLIIDRPHGEANFSMQWTGTATFHEIPVFYNPDAIPLEIVQCDGDGVNDNSTAFDLTVFEEMFIGSQTDVAITYYLDSNGMLTGENPLGNPSAYANVSSPQTIYMRMTNPVTGCFDTETLTIKLDHDLPAGEPVALSLCDTAGNGFREFNLAQNNTLISNGNANTSVTYYASEANAQNKVSPLPALYQNATAYTTQTIWARVEATSGCFRYGITSFTISMLPVPEMLRTDDFLPNVPLTIIKCDDDNVDDNATAFDLTVFEEMLKGAQPDVALTYHIQNSDAETGNNPLENPENYNNVANPQTIYLRMTNSVTGCFERETLTISIDHSLPVGTPETLLLCDTDGDGFGEFDLTQNDEPVINGMPNTAVTYFASEQDAENKNNPLPGSYQNENPDVAQTIWARLDTTSGCIRHGITPFTINIYPVPEMLRNEDLPPGTPLEIVECDDDGNDDGFTAFNLRVFEDMLIGTQNGVALTYYLDYNNALNGVQPVDNPQAFVNTSSPQTVYARMTYTATGCFVTENLTIRTDVDMPTGIPAALALCDDANNGVREFDLTQNDDAISNGDENTVVTYYATKEDAENETNPLPGLYQNEAPYTAQTIWARLEGNDGCFRYGITSFTISVYRLPEMMRNNEFPVGTPLQTTQCDSDDANDISTTFDLTVFEDMLEGSQANITFTYYRTADDMLTGANPIGTPQNYRNTSNPQTVYIRMTNSVTGCYTNETLTIVIDTMITTGTPDNLFKCDNGTGLAVFDLSQNNALIKDGRPGSVVNYYASEEDAESQQNPLPYFYRNQQPYASETVWARLSGTDGCYRYGIAPFSINILPVPEINYAVDVKDFTQNSNRITLSMTEASITDYEFSINGGDFSVEPFFDGLEPGVYKIRIRSKDGCSDTETLVPVLNYPKFFTPNGDGINEVWNVFFIYFFPDATVNIFDRYGKLIKSYLGKEMGWDGTYNGYRLPSTDYWFEVVFTSGRKIKGHFSMIR